jgi:uncharacterized membrane protein
MEISEKHRFKPEMTLNRIQALTDGIFAIAMTLLVLGIDLPEKDLSLSGIPLHKYLLNQLDQFYIYAMSFFIMAVFWIIGHKQSRYFKIFQTNGLQASVVKYSDINVCLFGSILFFTG